LVGAIWYLLEIPILFPFVSGTAPSMARTADFVAYYSAQKTNLLTCSHRSYADEEIANQGRQARTDGNWLGMLFLKSPPLLQSTDQFAWAK
jgi:hypothetical protein